MRRIYLSTFADAVLHHGAFSATRATSISRKGNAFLRTAVFMPALAAVRCNPRFNELYERLVAKGKDKKLALIAVARKLLLLIYALWKNDACYDPNYS